jgi:hypothetical protein
VSHELGAGPFSSRWENPAWGDKKERDSVLQLSKERQVFHLLLASVSPPAKTKQKQSLLQPLLKGLLCKEQ